MTERSPTLIRARASAAWLPNLAGALLATLSPLLAHGGETYEQQINVRFRNADAANRAEFSIAPLHDDHKRAVSCRWDDNWTSDNIKTREVMQEYGIRGTWYLNDRHFHPGKPDNLGEDYLPVARQLLAGGNSIGCHSLTHPFLTYFHANRMFAETMGCRIVWEAALDRPVFSYAYSFVDLRPEPEHDQVLKRTLDTLERAGLYHLSEYVSFFDEIDFAHELSPILPPENNPLDTFEKALTWAYTDPMLTEKWPMVCNSMHAWYGTPLLNYRYDELRERFQRMRALEDVWHCNQNQYAAYRRQYHASRLGVSESSGASVECVLKRPTLLGLDDPTPLTLVVSGVEPSEVVDASCPTASIELSPTERTDGKLFRVAHDREQRLPSAIGCISNPSNDIEVMTTDEDGDFPTLAGRLSFRKSQLSLALQNSSSDSLCIDRLVWRTPIGWKPDTSEAPTETTPSQSTLQVNTGVRPVGDPVNRIGRALFVAEVDFRLGDRTGRLFLTCECDQETVDESYPMNGFALLGPLGGKEFDEASFVEKLASEGCPGSWPTSRGDVEWRAGARDGYVRQEWLNPEYVRTSGTWDPESQGYVLRSRVTSPSQRRVGIVTSHAAIAKVFLNSEHVAADAELKAGDNELVIIYPAAKLSPVTTRLSACFVRLVDPSTGQRVTDLTYRQ